MVEAQWVLSSLVHAQCVLFHQVWLVLFILLVVVTVTARLFVWIYLNDGINHASMADELARRQRNDPLVYTFKHYIIYTVSILSNHGRYTACT